MEYAELQVTTNYSFLRGGSHPREMILQACELGYTAIAITDRNSLAGIVRAHKVAKEKGIRLVIGCRLDLQDGPSLLAYPTNKEAYARLSNLLTLGNRRTKKGSCLLYKEDVFAHAEGLLFILLPPDEWEEEEYPDSFQLQAKEYRQRFGKSLYLAASKMYEGDDAQRLYHLSSDYYIPLVVTNDVHYHIPERRELQDVLTCVREKCNIQTAGYRLFANAERYLKPITEMHRLFRKYPAALARVQEIVDACKFSLDELQYEYPSEIIPKGRTPMKELMTQTMKGARRFYGEHIPDKVLNLLKKEFALIGGKKNFPLYFLTIYDFIKKARREGILCQGRGSAANSAICFCLGITPVDPNKFEVLMERFVSEHRDGMPDVDIDFQNDRREEIIQYIYNKYGRDRAAIIATVQHVHLNGAVRDVGRAMGLSIDTVERLQTMLNEVPFPFTTSNFSKHGFNANDKHLLKTIELTALYIGFPRHLGQHTGGFVITNGKLSGLVPILNASMPERTCLEWDKDDIETLDFLKIDFLSLGMLTALERTLQLFNKHYNRNWTMAHIPKDDPDVFKMIQRGDNIGVFQIESPAQIVMSQRLLPEDFYRLATQIAIVRPGPIIGQMVHPYLRRRRGEEKYSYPSPEVEEILERTYGVPIFQEQAMKLAMVAAGFSGSKADELRRAMATFNLKLGIIAKFEKELKEGMLKNGYSIDYANELFNHLKSFASYGFPESHAIAFAFIAIATAWFKCWHPDLYLCGMLYAYPMGFYHPSQLIQDAQRHGVSVRAIDINYSLWHSEPEEKEGRYFAIRLGFKLIKTIKERDVDILIKNRKSGYTSIDQLRNTGISESAMIALADADAFRSIGLDRQQAYWAICNKNVAEGVFTGQELEYTEDKATLPEMSDLEHVLQDYFSLSLSVKAHPLSFIEKILANSGVTSAEGLKGLGDRTPVQVAGFKFVFQQPPTAKGICFITLEDQTGHMRLVVYPKVYEQYHDVIHEAAVLKATGYIQLADNVIHIIVHHCEDIKYLLIQQLQEEQRILESKATIMQEKKMNCKKNDLMPIQLNLFSQ